MRAYFVLLALIILVSGCVNPLNSGGGGGGPGVAINSFSFAPSNLKSNQLTKLSLSIENKGDYPIEDDAGVVYLFNLPNDWEITDKSDSTTNTETFSLLAPQTQGAKKYSGGSTGFEWVLRAPANLPKDEIFSYTAQARVCYPYKTKIWGRLEVVSENAWLQKPPAEHSIAVQQTQGPLKVEFLSKQPLMVETDVRIKVRITNAGDGVVTTNDCSVFATAVDDAEDNVINNLNHITLGDSDCTLGDELYLKKGQTKETYITCTPPALGSSPITASDFTMELIYNYYSDKKASVSVTGTSEDASGGMIGGGGIITLADLCTKSCDAAGQKPTNFDAKGMCRPEKEPSAYDYPPGNTFGFQLLLEPLGTDEMGGKSIALDKDTLSKIYSDKLPSVAIKDLKLHDARLGDFSPLTKTARDDGTLTVNGLLDLTLGELDSGTFSKQYTQEMLDADTDSDGLPDWFEEKYASKIISADKKDTDGNKVNDPDETYKNGKTYLEEYKENSGNTEVYPLRTLGIAKYICDNYPTGNLVGGTVTTGTDSCITGVSGIKLIELAKISFNGKEYKPLDNGADKEALRNLPIENLKITAIDGFTISEIAKSNPSRKIRSKISDINIGDVYVGSIPDFETSTKMQNFLKYSACAKSNAPAVYSRDIICKCMKDGSPPLEVWEKSSDSAVCDATCKNTLKIAGGGACSPSEYEKSTVCRNSKVVQIRQFDKGDGKMGCAASERCVCIEKTLATLSAQDVPIVCATK